ncbi:hypothetical protein AAFF_G00410840 [Aldrovandia affinis]|uniref:RanBP2-type domain-containing protein n=1 Tax=Aldrovandia affinis TaxID=143900 RepID=A0AAD7WJM5_9TELE|nr:hypothetical protein AAFF_G00410840 [Aldrovandia affinis]
MAKGGQRVDIQVLHALRPKSPEVPEGVVSQCLLQNNTSDSCSKYLSQTSTDFFQGEGGLDLLDKSGLSRLRNHMTQLHLGLRTQNAGVPPSQDGSMNGSRTLFHSLTDGPLQTGQPSSKFLRQEPPLSAPVQVPTGIGVFGAMDTTASPQLPQHLGLYQLGGKGHLAGAQQAPRFSPITVTVAPKVQAGRKTPTSLHIHGVPQSGMNSTQGNSIYIRPYVTQSGTSWYSLQQAGRPQCSSTTQQEQQQQQQAYQVSHPSTPPSWTLSSHHSTSHTSLPQSQGHQTLHVYMPISSPINPQAPSLLQTPTGDQPSSFSQYNIQNISTGPRKNQIEIKLESPQRNNSSATAVRSSSGPSSTASSCPSPASFSGAMSSSPSFSTGNSAQCRSQPTVYISASPPAAVTTAPDELVATTSSSRSQPTFYISTSSSGDEAGRCWNSPTVYISANPPLQGSPAGVRNFSGQVSMGPAYIHHHLPRSWASVGGGGGAVPSPRLVVNHPNTKYTFKITVSPNKPPAMFSGVPPPAFEHANLCSLPSDHCIEPEPYHLSDPLSMCTERPSELQRLSVGSDDLAYTQALLLHQKARMERLWHKLELKRHEVEKLKEEVSVMESDLTLRRLQRSSSTSKVPSMEEMQQLRGRNRKLQIDIDCLTKETVPLQPKDSTSKSPKTVRDIEEDEGTEWSCTACTLLNHPALLHCEECEFPRHF